MKRTYIAPACSALALHIEGTIANTSNNPGKHDTYSPGGSLSDRKDPAANDWSEVDDE